MSRAKTAFPYRTPTDCRVDHSPWTCEAGRALSLSLEGWDRSSHVSPQATVRIDLPGVLEDMGLVARARLKLIVICETGTTGSRMSRVVWSSPLDASGVQAIRLEAPLTGDEIVSEYSLETVLVLDDPGTVRAGAPALPGSRLWTWVERWDLDGDKRGFPIHPVDFAEVFRGKGMDDAPWFIEVHGAEVEAPLMNSVVVFLNTRRTKVHEALSEGDSELVGFLRADMIRTIATVVLTHGDVDVSDLEASEDGTLGAEVIGWLRSMGTEPGYMVEEAQTQPDRFAARVASTWGMSDG